MNILFIIIIYYYCLIEPVYENVFLKRNKWKRLLVWVDFF